MSEPVSPWSRGRALLLSAQFTEHSLEALPEDFLLSGENLALMSYVVNAQFCESQGVTR